jgi:hypothetical protein
LDGHFFRLRVPNGVGQTFLHATEHGEVDRIAVASAHIFGGEGECHLRVLT